MASLLSPIFEVVVNLAKLGTMEGKNLFYLFHLFFFSFFQLFHLFHLLVSKYIILILTFFVVVDLTNKMSLMTFTLPWSTLLRVVTQLVNDSLFKEAQTEAFWSQVNCLFFVLSVILDEI